MPSATIGRSLYALLGWPIDTYSAQEKHILSILNPPIEYDSLLRHIAYTNFIRMTPLKSPWVQRALVNNPLPVSAMRRYKPVDRKVRPVPTYMPNPSAQKFQSIPTPILTPLPHEPPLRTSFIPTERLTLDRLNQILSTIPANFLRPREIDLLIHVLDKHQKALAFTDAERGTFSQIYFPDYEMPVIEHVPWQKPPLRLPKATEQVLYNLLVEQRNVGKYEPSFSSYRSSIFLVAKKGGKYRIVHDLQPLNAISIRDAALVPNVNDFAESFVGCAIYMIADLFAGYDGRVLAISSRDLTTFGSPLGAHRLTSLPMGYCNAVQEFQRCIDHVLGEEQPANAGAFIDDVGIKGPRTTYDDETITSNSHIRRFVYEFLTTVDRIFARFEQAGITASGHKLIAATPKLHIVGTTVSMEGWHLDHGVVSKVLKWEACRNVTEVRSFLGVAGIARRWIKGYAMIARPLTALTRKDIVFAWSAEAQEAMNLLKHRITTAPVLRTIDYHKAKIISPPLHEVLLDGLVIVAVDSSVHGSGWILLQVCEGNKHPTLFGSCTFNEVEGRYSQPKLELYGVFRALKELRHRVWGIFFRLDVDAKFLKQMIKSPDLPNAPMTRWISYIQLFDFAVHHIPATQHQGPDGLSRRIPASDDSGESDGEDQLDRLLQGLSLRNTLRLFTHHVKCRQSLSSAPFFDSAMFPHGYAISTIMDSTATESQNVQDGMMLEIALQSTEELLFISNDFMRRNVAREYAQEYELDGQQGTFPITEYRYAFDIKPPANQGNLGITRASYPMEGLKAGSKGHRFGKLDKEREDQWQEIQNYLTDRVFPEWCKP